METTDVNCTSSKRKNESEDETNPVKKKTAREETQTTSDDDSHSKSAESKKTVEETAEHEIKDSKDDTDTKYFNGVEISQLTKRQMKKYKRMLKWLASKKEKRAKERLKTKNKKIEAKRNNIDLGPSRKQLKNSKMADSSCKTGVVIDLSFDDLMISKDMGKVIKQILRVYTENRRSKAPMQLYLTSFVGKCKEEMSKHNGYEHWDINFHEGSYLDVFPKEKLVYLSSESDNVITDIEPDKIYIIGGLVDHNAHKGVCYKKAVEQGIDHGQLPIREFFYMKRRKVFTINQVFEILLRVSEGKTFKEAFESVLPKRINMQPTTSDTENIDSDADVDDSSKDNVTLEETECS